MKSTKENSPVKVRESQMKVRQQNSSNENSQQKSFNGSFSITIFQGKFTDERSAKHLMTQHLTNTNIMP
ncbi:24838_t:CDS:2, partial [Gigaspora margarita]